MLGWRDERELAEVLPAKEAKALTKAFGYTHCYELLEHYPRTYRQHGDAAFLSEVAEGDIATVVGTVARVQTIQKPRTLILRMHVHCASEIITVTFFNAQYARRALREGTTAMFSGKVTRFRGEAQLQHPDFYVVDSAGSGTGSLKALSQYGSLLDDLSHRQWIPIYPATSSMNTWRIMGAVWRILETLGPIPEPLPEVPQNLLSFDEAYRLIHAPDARGPEPAIERLKYNEALSLGLTMAVRRQELSEKSSHVLPPVPDGYQASLRGALPFSLTKGQQEVLEEITKDLALPHPMSRLLQGEVGSGKTIIALLAMLQAADNGRQSALLAPTEVLAVQHARSLTNTLAQAGVAATVVALTGSMPTAQKREALLKVVSGEVDIVVGTHSLIQDTVEFFDLGLVVVDEQHRFGVEQRDILRSKGREGITPHVLVMTATPIPRTIAMTVFGDLAVSTLRELPGGRKPIQSAVVPEFNRSWVNRAWERIAEEVSAGYQAYVVCPRIEGEGGAQEMHEELSARFGAFTVGLLHGRLHSEDKDSVMGAFAAGKIDILVATTVIEVGVDVANATVMLVRESENFGMSQLHQLRGRVGRGGNHSLCLFHTAAENGSPAFERVAAVAATNDGFELAHVDLRHRHEGDVLGTSQSGTRRSLKLLDLIEDYEVIARAQHDAAELTERDIDRARELAADVKESAREYLDKA
ncbi:ATP-dependent DNA helicase RecG [Corynebacterium tapiri]|uniref:Probable DNA 3'-5' helicase RecG n=1 Tax=Corynebacterium tapiri TaxID=1448266 RepID=A0A5C4U5Y2_9CORY|nr:ATP-dependent DNA helicase RecG [Corynebacterium tapiri]TNL99819.1 ATP-dependent DNA helicase RecG [Corynebacterium tapiri]